MLATFLASTPLLSNCWKLCESANSFFHHSFLSEQIGNVGYVGFSGVQSADCGADLEILQSAWNVNGVFSCLQHQKEESIMVHGGFLRVFQSVYADPGFQYQVSFFCLAVEQILFYLFKLFVPLVNYICAALLVLP